MLRWMGAGALFCLALGACAIDARQVEVVGSSLLPGGGVAGAAEGLAVQPSSFAYGPITVGFAASARFLLENRGVPPLAVPEVWVEGDGASAFTITENGCTTSLVSGEHCELALAFRPSELAARGARLMIASGRTVEVALFGSGLEPGGLLLQAAPGSDINFGDVPLRGERQVTLRLSNPTELDSGPFELFSNNAAFSLIAATGSECVSRGAGLAGGQSCDFRLRFAPVQRGATDGTITARSGAAGSVSLGVSGAALSPARMLVDRALLDFGDVVVAGAAVLDLSVRNVGDEPMSPVMSVLAGDPTGAFEVSANGCSAPQLAGASCSISVSFSPAGTGPHGAVLDLDAGSAGSQRVDLSGGGLPAGNLFLAAVDGNAGSFGSVALGSETERVFRVSNAASGPSGPLQLTVNSDEFAIVPASEAECAPGVTDLGAGSSCELRVRFAPRERRQRNATLTVAGAVGGVVLNLSGVGLAPAALEAESPVDFGGVPQRSTATRSVSVRSSGDEVVTAITTGLSGPDASSFAVEQNGCAAGLSALGPCSISVAFTPIASGSHLATLSLIGEPGGARDVALSGLGLEPGALELMAAAGSSTAFGDRPVGDAALPPSQTFILANSGQTASGTISILPLSGSFSVAAPAGTDCVSNVTRLAAGATCTIRVLFAPATRGSNTATLSATSVDAGSASLTLSGVGLGPAVLGVQPAQQLFAAPVVVGETSRATLTLINPGDAPTGAIGVNIIATRSGFSVTPGTCRGALVGGASCALDVAFAPMTPGLHSASVRVTSTPGGVLEVPLSGVGVAPPTLDLLAVESTDFGAVGIGAASTRSFTLRNSGDLSAGTVLGITLGSGFSLAPRVGSECLPNVTLLDGGASCTFRVVFQPSASGNFGATMVATTSSGGSSSLPITGQGLAPPVLSASATRLAFVGSVFPGNQGSETLTWTITNTGGGPTLPLEFSNSNPQEIRSFPEQCLGLRLAPGTDCPITMQLAPLIAGQRSATFTVSSGSLSVSVVVTGVGG